MTNFRTIKVATATLFWTVAVALGISGTESSDIRLLFWSGIAALVACLVSNHVAVQGVIRQERINVELLVEGLITSAEKKVEAEVRSLR